MKYFRLRFVAASLGIGLVLTLSSVSFAQAASWTATDRVPIISIIFAFVSLLTAGVIGVYSWQELSTAWRHPGKHHAHRP